MRAAGRLRKALPAWLGKKQICCVLAGLLLGGIAQAAGAAGTEGAAGELRRPGYGQEEETRQVYIDLTSPGFFDIMYRTMAGRLVMSGCLAVYGISLLLARRILQVEI